MTQSEVTGHSSLLGVKDKIHNDNEDYVSERSGSSCNLSGGVKTQGDWQEAV
jgi:hypothetical protein